MFNNINYYFIQTLIDIYFFITVAAHSQSNPTVHTICLTSWYHKQYCMSEFAESTEYFSMAVMFSMIVMFEFISINVEVELSILYECLL